jgi:S1-C subfamily serine protease
MPSRNIRSQEEDPYGAIGEESARRRRRQRTKRMLIFVGVPILAFILISEGVNLLQRNNSFQQKVAGEAVKQAIKQGPEILANVGGSEGDETEPPPMTSAPASAAPPAASQETPVELGASDRPADLPGLIAAIVSSTVLVECQVSADEWSQGSGFVMDSSPLSTTAGTVIVTNAHIFEACLTSGPVFVTTTAGVEYEAAVAEADQQGDLAFLAAPGLGLPALPPSTEFQQGDWVMAAGNPQGVTGTTTIGTVANYKPEADELFSDALIAPGSSGGPLVNNKGEVIGVTSWILTESSGFSISRPIKRLCNVLLDCR